MLKISLPYMVELAVALEPLGTLPEQDMPRTAVWWSLFTAQTSLHALTQSSVYAPYLRSSWNLSQELLNLLTAEITMDQQANPTIGQLALWGIKQSWNRYRIAMLADFGALESYFVVQQGGYDTRTLMERGELIFPSDLLSKVPSTLFDARQTAKCLALAVPTAAGFHIFRVLEAVLRRYYAIVTGGASQPKVRNIGVYLNALKMAQKGNPIVLATLKQVADLHRNPLIHPEAALTMDEAISALGIARSAVTAMLSEIPILPPTTATASSALPSP